MKTAISIDDDLLQEADQAARLMRLSRSQLFALAISDFLRQRRQERMLLRLNEVYANGPDATERRLLRGIKASARRGTLMSEIRRIGALRAASLRISSC